MVAQRRCVYNSHIVIIIIIITYNTQYSKSAAVGRVFAIIYTMHIVHDERERKRER